MGFIAFWNFEINLLKSHLLTLKVPITTSRLFTLPEASMTNSEDPDEHSDLGFKLFLYLRKPISKYFCWRLTGLIKYFVSVLRCYGAR